MARRLLTRVTSASSSSSSCSSGGWKGQFFLFGHLWFGRRRYSFCTLTVCGFVELASEVDEWSDSVDDILDAEEVCKDVDECIDKVFCAVVDRDPDRYDRVSFAEGEFAQDILMH